MTDTKNTIEKIIQSFRRGEDRPRTAREELERLDEEIKKMRRVTLACKKCGKDLVWKNPDGSSCEVPLIPSLDLSSEKVHLFCPFCKAPISKRGVEPVRKTNRSRDIEVLRRLRRR